MIQDKIDKIKKERSAINKKRTKSMFSILAFACVVSVILTFYLFANKLPLRDMLISDFTSYLFFSITIGISALASIVLSYLTILETSKDQRNNYKELELYQKMLKATMEEREKNQTLLKHFEMHISDINSSSLDFI